MAKSAEIDPAKAAALLEFAMRQPDLQGSRDPVAGEPSSPISGVAEERVVAADSADDPPLIWPILSAADRAAAGPPPQSSTVSEHLLALLAGALAVAAMIARTLFKPVAVDGFGWSDFRGPRHPTPNANSHAPRAASSRPDRGYQRGAALRRPVRSIQATASRPAQQTLGADQLVL